MTNDKIATTSELLNMRLYVVALSPHSGTNEQISIYFQVYNVPLAVFGPRAVPNVQKPVTTFICHASIPIVRKVACVRKTWSSMVQSVSMSQIALAITTIRSTNPVRLSTWIVTLGKFLSKIGLCFASPEILAIK